MQIRGILGLIFAALFLIWASLVAQLVKNLPAVQETWVQSLDWEDPLEKGSIACLITANIQIGKEG